MNATEAARTYAHSSAMTAGDLKSHQILLERALVLIALTRQGDLNARNRAQDIVAQLQHSLNLSQAPAKRLFEVYGHIWDALEWNENVYLDRAEDLLRQIRDVIVQIQRK